MLYPLERRTLVFGLISFSPEMARFPSTKDGQKLPQLKGVDIPSSADDL